MNDIIRNVEVGELILGPDELEPYFEVKMRVYPEMKQDLTALVTRQEECRIIGEQLINAVEKCKGKWSKPTPTN